MGKRDDRREAAAAIPPEDLEAEWVSDPELVDRLLVAPEQRRFNPLSIALTLITIAALITGAWFAAKLTWLLVYEPPPIAVGDLPTPAPARPQQQVDVTALIDAHLFGKPEAPEQSGPPPDTRLPIVLQGIIFTDVKEDARAIIAGAGEPQNSFRIGQTVADNAVLQEIHPGFVIIERDGVRETLRLRSDDEAAGVVGSAPRQPVHRRHDLRGDYQLGKVLGRVQARLMTDPGSVMSVMRIVPVTNATGDIQGVKVFPGPEPGLFQAFKLQPGDLLTSINGIPLDSPARGLEVLRNLAAAQELELELLRAGKRLAYNFSVVH